MVTILVFFAIRRQLISLLGSAKMVTIKLPGGVEVAVMAKEATDIAQDLFNFLETLSTSQVRLLFRLIRIESANEQFVIPEPDHDRENTFHNDLRILREGHLVHAVGSDGKPAGRFKAGRLVKLFPWAFKLPDLAKEAKTSDGRLWSSIQEQIMDCSRPPSGSRPESVEREKSRGDWKDLMRAVD